MRDRQSTKARLELIHCHEHFPALERVLKRLLKAGYPTVLAGGCVRDSLLGVHPKDLDLATAALPEVVESLFERTLAVGKAFGTMVVVQDGMNFEVTTFRKDGAYLDGRHPVSVDFTDMEQDAQRRDFTVNALFYDPLQEEILDFVQGIGDLDRRLLRTVGRAEQRFTEDRLRMLRAARFVAQTGFSLEAQTQSAIRDLHATVVSVSPERVFNELRRLLSGPFLLEGLEIFVRTQLSEVLWPELSIQTVDKLVKFVPLLTWENVFAALMFQAPESAVEARLEAWKAPRDSQRRVRAQIDGCKMLLDSSSRRSDRARVLGGEVFAEALQLARGFAGPGQIELWIQEFLQVADQAGVLPKPFLNGQDLLQKGIPPGEHMGRLLKSAYDAQLEGHVKSKEEALAKIAVS